VTDALKKRLQGALALLTMVWDFIDTRQIDAHVVAGIVLWCTVRISEWAMAFVNLHPDKPGLEVAAILGAVLLPWTTLQGAVIKFHFNIRNE
jgi:hypothetical protein